MQLVPCEEDQRFCENQSNLPDCSEKGFSCDISGCKYQIEKDPTIEKEKKHKIKGMKQAYFLLY